MGMKERAEISIGGPDGQSTWGDEGDSFTIQNHAAITASVTASILPGQTITRANGTMASPGGGTAYQDTLPAGASIQSLFGAQITPSAVLAAATNLTLAITVYRNATLSVALTSGVAITQLTFTNPIVSPMPSGQTITLTNLSGNTTTATTSAAVAAGQTVIPINSLTPGNTYAVTSYVVYQVGNMPVFGWLYNPGGGFSGVTGQNGTPQFPANGNLLMPAISANTALLTAGPAPYLPVIPGDGIQVLLQTGSSTVNVPVTNLQPLLV